MEYIVNGLLILLLGTLYFFAIRYLFRKGTCAGCSSCKSHGEVSSCFLRRTGRQSKSPTAVNPSYSFEEESIMLSAAKKRYLFAIYELGQTGKPIRSKDIASSLKLKPPSVSKMLNALSEDDLIEKEFYGTVTFTQSGAAMANQLYMDYLTLFAFFHQALEIPEFHARKDAILCLCDLSEPSRKKIASVILDSRGVS